MKLDRAYIARRVPHTGAMCLLDTVLRWDATEITCSAGVFSLKHPLARDGKVPALVSVEYAAQATAVHGALLDNQSAPRAGMLARLHEVELQAESIPSDGEQLTVSAQLLSRGASGMIYTFKVESGGQAIARGRLTIAFNSHVAS